MPGRKKKTFTVLAIGLLLVLGLNPDPTKYGLSAGSAWWTGITYMFLHVSLVHLGMNLWVLYQLMRKVSWTNLALSTLLAMLVPGFCLTPLPTVGLSGMLFASCGMMWFRFNSFKDSQLYFGILLSFGLVAWLFGANINPFIHLWCYAMGFITGILIKPSWKTGKNC